MTRRTGLVASLAVALAAAVVANAAASELQRPLQEALETHPRAAPEIVLHAPRDGGAYASPLGIDIGFQPASDAEIDLSTLKVTVVTHTLIGDLSFDITDDVSPFASPAGILAQRASIPAGEHTVTISVADTLERRAERQLTFVVRDGRDQAE